MNKLFQFFFRVTEEPEKSIRNNQSIQVLDEILGGRMKLSIRPGSEHKADDACYVTHPVELDLNELNPQLLITELYSSDEKHALTKNESLIVECRNDGILYRFESRVVSIGAKSNGSQYGISIPNTIDCIQIRGSYRVNVKRPDYFPLTLEIGDRPPIKGHMSDCSYTGLGLIIPGSVTPPLEVGDFFKIVNLELEDNSHLHFSMELKNIYVNPQQSFIAIGAGDLNFFEGNITEWEKLNARLQRKERSVAVDR